MQKLELSQYTKLEDLPLDQFNQERYSIYVTDRQWNYIFVNDFVKVNLGERGQDLKGKNMWQTFPELARDPHFGLLRTSTENGQNSNLVTVSPITGQRLNITGHALADCYVFTSSIIPRKEDVLDHLRKQLPKSPRHSK